MKIVRNPVMARLKGTSGNSKGERFFDLLSGTPRVRIAPGMFASHSLFWNGLWLFVRWDKTHEAAVLSRGFIDDAVRFPRPSYSGREA